MFLLCRMMCAGFKQARGGCRFVKNNPSSLIYSAVWGLEGRRARLLCGVKTWRASANLTEGFATQTAPKYQLSNVHFYFTFVDGSGCQVRLCFHLVVKYRRYRTSAQWWKIKDGCKVFKTDEESHVKEAETCSCFHWKWQTGPVNLLEKSRMAQGRCSPAPTGKHASQRLGLAAASSEPQQGPFVIINV